MSEPIKLTEDEVEFWKACVVAIMRADLGNYATASADNAVMALRERTPKREPSAYGAVFLCHKCGTRWPATSSDTCPICAKH